MRWAYWDRVRVPGWSACLRPHPLHRCRRWGGGTGAMTAEPQPGWARKVTVGAGRDGTGRGGAEHRGGGGARMHRLCAMAAELRRSRPSSAGRTEPPGAVCPLRGGRWETVARGVLFGGAAVLGYPGCWNLGLLVGEVISAPLWGRPTVGVPRGCWGAQLLGSELSGYIGQRRQAKTSAPPLVSVEGELASDREKAEVPNELFASVLTDSQDSHIPEPCIPTPPGAGGNPHCKGTARLTPPHEAECTQLYGAAVR